MSQLPSCKSFSLEESFIPSLNPEFLQQRPGMNACRSCLLGECWTSFNGEWSCTINGKAFCALSRVRLKIEGDSLRRLPTWTFAYASLSPWHSSLNSSISVQRRPGRDLWSKEKTRTHSSQVRLARSWIMYLGAITGTVGIVAFPSYPWQYRPMYASGRFLEMVRLHALDLTKSKFWKSVQKW